VSVPDPVKDLPLRRAKSKAAEAASVAVVSFGIPQEMKILPVVTLTVAVDVSLTSSIETGLGDGDDP